MPDDFTTLAANAAAMNAEEAFDRCLSELQENSASDAKLSWILRVADMSKEDARAQAARIAELEARLATSITMDLHQQILVASRDTVLKEAADKAGALLPENGAGQACDATDRLIDATRRECVESILALRTKEAK